MRKLFPLLGLLALALPVAGVAGSHAGEGTLSVEDGRGKITLQAKGGVIGRLDRGYIRICDLTPEDPNVPFVWGDDQPRELIGDDCIRFGGQALRFRLGGGGYKILIVGKGIDLSAVGKGAGTIKGEEESPGLYSLDGADCRSDRTSCKPLPEIERRFQLGVPERGEKSLISAGVA
jgi:hypothetical protein